MSPAPPSFPGSQGRRCCLVISPVGKKPQPCGGIYDFDDVRRRVIDPVVKAMGLEPLYTSEEHVGEIIDKVMFERLVLSRFAIVDLTTSNPNILYGLGVRHATRPFSTVAMFARGTSVPFDAGLAECVAYDVDSNGAVDNLERTAKEFEAALERALVSKEDSPLFQLLDGMAPPDISRLKTDEFRQRVAYSRELKDRLAEARTAKDGLEEVRAIKGELEPIRECEAAVVIDLFLSFRAIEAWGEMIALIDEMDPALRGTVMVQEQLGLALNRIERHREAELVLLDLVEKRGMSGETGGILGRVYKDQWWKEFEAGHHGQAQSWLRKAIDAYRRGFEVDWRDAYPGINAVSLMEFAEPPDPVRRELFPVVAYAVRRRIALGRSDFWDWATLLELAVLQEDRDGANRALEEALVRIREQWEPKSTVKKLRMIRQVRKGRGQCTEWILDVEQALSLEDHAI